MLKNAKFTYASKGLAIVFWIFFLICVTTTAVLAQKVMESDDEFNMFLAGLVALASLLTLYQAITFSIRARKYFTLEFQTSGTDNSTIHCSFSALSPYLMNQSGKAQLVAVKGIDLIAGVHSRSYEQIEFEVKQSITFGQSFQMALHSGVLERKDVLWFLMFSKGSSPRPFASFQLQNRFN